VGLVGRESLYGKKYLGIIRSAFVVDEKGKLAACSKVTRRTRSRSQERVG